MAQAGKQCVRNFHHLVFGTRREEIGRMPELLAHGCNGIREGMNIITNPRRAHVRWESSASRAGFRPAGFTELSNVFGIRAVAITSGPYVRKAGMSYSSNTRFAARIQSASVLSISGS